MRDEQQHKCITRFLKPQKLDLVTNCYYLPLTSTFLVQICQNTCRNHTSTVFYMDSKLSEWEERPYKLHTSLGTDKSISDLKKRIKVKPN